MAKKKEKSSSHSVFVRYYLISALFILLSFIIFGLTLLVFISNHWWNEKKDMLNENIIAISQNYVEAVSSNVENSQFNTLILAKNIETTAFATESDYFICDTKGKVIVCPEFFSNNGEICEKHKNMTLPDDVIGRAKTESFSMLYKINNTRRDYYLVAVPIMYNGIVVGEAFAVEDAITGLVPYVTSLMKMLFITILMALVFVYIFIYIYTRKMTKPLSGMIEAIDRYAKGDFTYHVKADNSYRQMQEMARALNKMVDEIALDDEAKRSFVANVSHELKTPMTTISLFVDGILDGTIPRDKETEYLQTVSREVKRLSRLVVSMLNLSKIESGEVKLNRVPYNLASQIVEVLLSMQQRLEEGKIQIEGMEDIADETIVADKDLFHQVLYNLVDNAVKFTPAGGTISFFVKNTDTDFSLTVRNTGKGLSKEEMNRVFERFYKVDQSRSYDVKGVGLGLYIVKTIVNMHEGKIDVDSVQGEYTEFTLIMPKK